MLRSFLEFSWKCIEFEDSMENFVYFETNWLWTILYFIKESVIYLDLV